jgi:hypothetical protein
MVSDQQIRNVTDHLDSCEDICTLQAASTRYKNAEINEKLKQKLSLDPKNKWPEKKWTLFTACQACQRGKIRLTSISKEEHNTKLHPNHKRYVNQLNIDIIVTIDYIESKNLVICVLYKDLNGNFTKYHGNGKRPPIEIGKRLSFNIEKINTTEEYWSTWLYEPFFFNAHQSWKRIKERMDQTEFPGIKASS